MNIPSAMNKRKRKSWDDCSSRQKKRRIEDIKEKIVKVDEDFEVTEITLRSKANRETKVVKTSAGHLQEKENKEDTSTGIVCQGQVRHF